MRYRIAIGIDPEIWTRLTIDRFSGSILDLEEEKTLNVVKGTMIFYTKDPNRVFRALDQDGWDLGDFRWVNISRET